MFKANAFSWSWYLFNQHCRCLLLHYQPLLLWPSWQSPRTSVLMGMCLPPTPRRLNSLHQSHQPKQSSGLTWGTSDTHLSVQSQVQLLIESLIALTNLVLCTEGESKGVFSVRHLLSDLAIQTWPFCIFFSDNKAAWHQGTEVVFVEFEPVSHGPRKKLDFNN